MSRLYRVCWALLALLVVVGGCSKGSTSVGAVPVTGLVLLDNEPVAGVTVSFSPDDPKKGMAAVGTTDSQGRFKLTTRVAGDGAVPGEYTVTISKSSAKATGTATVAASSDPRSSSGNLTEEQKREALAKMTEAQKQKTYTSGSDIPAKYASRDTSGFTASVTSGGPNELTFAMTK